MTTVSPTLARSEADHDVAAADFRGAMRTSSLLLLDALVAADCKVEDIIERHSHGIVIGRVRDLIISSSSAALAYWRGQYVNIGSDEEIASLAEVGVPRIPKAANFHFKSMS